MEQPPRPDDHDLPAGPYRVYAAPSARGGRGVFAAGAFSPGEVVEVCELIHLPTMAEDALAESDLNGYVFDFHGVLVLALGCGSLYNHATASNATYEFRHEPDLIVVVAVAPIAPGDEILVNYLGEPHAEGDLWFEPSP
jgi:hypothetical protein